MSRARQTTQRVIHIPTQRTGIVIKNLKGLVKYASVLFDIEEYPEFVLVKELTQKRLEETL